MKEKQTINWVILAGGRASRMGGNDKGLIEFQGKPLIKWIIDSLSQQTNSIFINANRSQEQYQSYAETFNDQITGFVGPLAGVHSAIKHSEGFEWIGVLPCDSPYIPDDFVQRFTQAMAENTNSNIDAFVAYDGQFIQPVFAVYHCSILNKLENFLKNGDRKIKMFLESCQVQLVDFSDSTTVFINLNTPEDLSNPKV
ncbi:MAG: molybdenum cofactor guanylyltransferase MobA [Vibrio sp.]